MIYVLKIKYLCPIKGLAPPLIGSICIQQIICIQQTLLIYINPRGGHDDYILLEQEARPAHRRA